MRKFILKHDLFFSLLLAVVCVLAAASPFVAVVWLAEAR
ncbi:putative membrane protein [Brucella rhizosphaerae]|uniref:Putative membrane protein n=1 Tax=Brucella rhizosphaerae TaxID=571254 RepID=A0A256FHZ3_9HYPH|nr:putative membrane protein [Brucella rhizosphaerae]